MDFDLSSLLSYRGLIAILVSSIVAVKGITKPITSILMLLFLFTVAPHQIEIFPGIETVPVVKMFAILAICSMVVNCSRINADGGQIWSTNFILLILLSLSFFSSALFSKSPEKSINFIINLVMPVFILAIMVQYILNKPAGIYIFSKFFCYYILFIALYCIKQYITPGGLVDYYDDMDRILYYGGLSDPNDLAQILVGIFPFFVFFFFSANTKINKLFWGGAGIFILLAIILTFSRGGFLALFICCSLIFYFLKKNFATVIIVIILFCSLVSVSPPVYKQRMLSIGASQDTGEIVDRASQNRLILWKAGLNMLSSHPWTGVGVGNFTDSLEEYLPPEYTLRKAQTAHNSYILIAAETGIPGLTVFLLLIFTALHRLTRQSFIDKQSMQKSKFGYSAAVLAGFSGILVSSFFLSRSYSFLIYTFAVLASKSVLLGSRN